MGMHAQTQQRLHTADDDKTPGVASHSARPKDTGGRQTLRPNLNTPLFAGFRPFFASTTKRGRGEYYARPRKHAFGRCRLKLNAVVREMLISMRMEMLPRRMCV